VKYFTEHVEQQWLTELMNYERKTLVWNVVCLKSRRLEMSKSIHFIYISSIKGGMPKGSIYFFILLCLEP